MAAVTNDLTIRRIADLTPRQMAMLGALQVTEQQAFHGKSFAESLADWRDLPADQVLGLCVLSSQTPVGLALFQRSGPCDDTASIHGLKIALPWQGRGWGHVAFALSVRALQRAWPDVALLTLSVDADNAAALAVYRGHGLLGGDHVHQGRHGAEYRMQIAL